MEKRTRIDWREQVATWRGSGLSGREFAATIGVSGATIHAWAQRVRAEQQRGAMTLARVETKADRALPSAQSSMAVELPGGAVVRVHADFDETLLRRVAAALGRSP